MKAPIALTLLILALPAAHAADFEGTVSMKMTPAGSNSMTMNYSLKGGLIRIDMGAGGARGGAPAAMIMNPAKKEMTILMTEQNMYMVQPIPDVAPTEPRGKTQERTFEKTSETEKILGYTATKYISKSGNDTTEMWLSTELGNFMAFDAMGRGGMMGRGRGAAAPAAGQEWAELLNGKSVFPLRVVTKDAAGKETFRMEAAAIDKKSLPDTLFAPPAGAQDIGAMMGGAMRGALRGMIPGRGN